MRTTPLGFTLAALLILVGSIVSQEDNSLDQILERAYQREKAFHENLIDYICQATTTILEPQKDGSADTLSVVEKTVYRKLPDKRLEKFTAITKDGQALSPEEIAEIQKKQSPISLGRGRSFFGPQERANYTYELLPPDTVRGFPSYVLRIKPKEKKKDLVDGKIWLHQDNFEVVKLNLRPAKYPRFLKKANVIFEFEEVQPDFWLPTKIEIDAQAGFWFIKKNRQIHETWRDYQINVGLPDSLFAIKQ